MNSEKKPREKVPKDIPEYIFSKRWLTPEETALYLSMSKHTLYEKVEKKHIPFYRMPHSPLLRFDRLALDAWMKEGKNGTLQKKRNVVLQLPGP